MNFEFVEFYPSKHKKNKRMIGTVHIYVIDCQLDIRGISVSAQGNGMYFRFPHFTTIDHETGQPVIYPHLRWTNEETHKEMMDFLQAEVKPIIQKRLIGEKNG